jgi:hypothetical protein
MKTLCTTSLHFVLFTLLVIAFNPVLAYLRDELLETVTDYLDTQYDIHEEKHFYIHN